MPLRVVCGVLLQRFPRKATTLVLAFVCVFCSMISSQAAAEDVTRRPNSSGLADGLVERPIVD
jgi:hypothetical protein